MLTKHKPIIGLSIISIIVISLYWKGVYGSFLYDDFSNLNALANINDDFSSILHFIFNNISGPLGRPASMATFVANGQTWPTDPYYFKVTNVFLHILCGWLIFFFVKKIISRIDTKISNKRVELIALSTAAVWLLHPLHVSTTLYVVQRMTQLSTLFSLLAIITFLHYLKHLPNIQKIGGFIIPTFVLTGLISLAVFSKENALLVFPSMLLINYFCQKKESTLKYKIWSFSIFTVPTLICLAALLSKGIGASDIFELKHFTMIERLLTEARVVSHYLGQILLPDFTSMTIYHDDYIISKSLFEPITTILSIIFLAALLLLLLFKINPIYKFAISWFMLWHLIESTILPLDIYFEHRNYTASIGPLLGLVYGIFKVPFKKAHAITKSKLLVITYSLFLSTQLFMITDKWSDEEELYLHWLTNHESSRLTFLTLTQYYIKYNMLPVANNIMEKASNLGLYSDDIDFHLLHYSSQCLAKKNTAVTIQKLLFFARKPKAYKTNSLSNYKTLIANILNNRCKPLDLSKIHAMLTLMENNAPQKKNKIWLSDLKLHHSYIYLHYNQLEKALILAIQSFETAKSAKSIIKIIEINVLLARNAQAARWVVVASKYNKSHKSPEVSKFLLDYRIE